MKKTIFGLCAFLLLVALVQADTASVAVTLKAVGNSELLRADASSYQSISKGDRINLGDHIRTGVTGTVALVFQDDLSQLKIRPETEVIIGGRRIDREVEKMLELPLGRIWVEVTKRDTEFRIATPTSVASVKGTRFWVIVDEAGATTVITLEGIVNLRNVQSGEVVDIEAGSTGVSQVSGKVSTHETSPEEIKEYTERSLHEMEIPFRNDDNDQKILRIQYYE